MRQKIIVFLCCMSSIALNAQNSSLVINTKGYIFNLGGILIFQPYEIESHSHLPLDVLDKRSFMLGNIPGHDGLWEAIAETGDTVSLTVHNRVSNESDTINCRYFYCELTVSLLLFDSIDKPKLVTPLRYELSYRNQRYSCYGYSIKNKILKVLPSKKKDLDKIYAYYKSNDFVIPKWLDEIYNPNRAKSIKTLDYNDLIKMQKE